MALLETSILSMKPPPSCASTRGPSRRLRKRTACALFLAETIYSVTKTFARSGIYSAAPQPQLTQRLRQLVRPGHRPQTKRFRIYWHMRPQRRVLNPDQSRTETPRRERPLKEILRHVRRKNLRLRYDGRILSLPDRVLCDWEDQPAVHCRSNRRNECTIRKMRMTKEAGASCG